MSRKKKKSTISISFSFGKKSNKRKKSLLQHLLPGRTKRHRKFNLYLILILIVLLLIPSYWSQLLWIILCIAIILSLNKLVPVIIKNNKLKKAGINEIDRMNGDEFEEYLAFIFTGLGYKAQKTKTSGDFGADIVLQKDGIKTVVQAKRYSSKVDLSAVQEIVASMRIYKSDAAIVVTNNYYTNAAVELAQANSVELWNREQLIEKILIMKKIEHRNKVRMT